MTTAVRAWLHTPEGAAPWSAALDRRMRAQFEAAPDQIGPCAEILVSGAKPRGDAQMRVAITALIWAGVLGDATAVSAALTLTVEALLLSPETSWSVLVRAEQGPEWEEVSAAVTVWLRALAAVVKRASRPRGSSPLRQWFGRGAL